MLRIQLENFHLPFLHYIFLIDQRQDVLIIRQIRSLLYDDGFTIGGARQRLTGDEAKSDLSQSQQIIKQLRIELEQVLKILRR